MAKRGMNSISAAQSRPAQPAQEQSLTGMLLLTDWRWFVPETLALLALVSLVRPLLPESSAGFGNLPHPFWIPVLLMSAQYGIMGGLFAALTASAAYLVYGLPAQSSLQDFYGWAGMIAAQPCAWCGSALVIGGLRSLHIHNQTALQVRLDQTCLTADDLADALQAAVDEIGRLEHRIATDTTTLASLLDSLAKIELTNQRALLAGIAAIIRHGVGATSISIHLNGPNGPAPCLITDDDGHSAAIEGSGLPLEALIRRNDDAETLGVVTCHRLLPEQVPAIAAQRLNAVCRLLSVLLPACPGVGQNDGQ